VDDKLGDLLDEPENCVSFLSFSVFLETGHSFLNSLTLKSVQQTLMKEERQAMNETLANSNPELPPFLLPFRAHQLVEDLDYLHRQQDQIKANLQQPLDSSLGSSPPTRTLVSNRLIATVYGDLNLPSVGSDDEHLV